MAVQFRQLSVHRLRIASGQTSACPFAYMETMRDFHHTKGWRRIRETAMRKAGYQCQMSKRYGRNVQAQMVHHALPVEDYPQYAMSLWNLVPMTNEWHNKMHERITHKLTEEGQRLAKRIAQQNGVDYGNQEDRDQDNQEGCTEEG